MFRKLLLVGSILILLVTPAVGVIAQTAVPPGQSGTPQPDNRAPDQVNSVSTSLGTGFTYQGRLTKAGALVNDTCDMLFSLWSAESGGEQIGERQSMPSVIVKDSLFTVLLNNEGRFGDSAFDGQARFLKVEVHCYSDPAGSYTTLTPWQELTAAPYAVYAQSSSSVTNGTFIDIVNAVNNGVLVRQAGNDGVHVENANKDGLEVVSAGAAGVIIGNAGRHGLDVVNARDDGVHVRNANNDGLEVVSAGAEGLIIGNVGRSGVDVVNAQHQGVRIRQANLNGVLIEQAGADGLRINHANGDGIVVQSAGGHAAVFQGTVQTSVLEITGGSDLAERFEVDGNVVEPGTLMVIDEKHSGRLKPSVQPYDTKVAGVVSGAGDVKPGLTLQQEGVLDGDTQVAIAGRVYVKATSSNGSIEPGDLLTTSDQPGYAMKATDHDRSQGAVIGKAMTGLKTGTGLVLVLVNLQ